MSEADDEPIDDEFVVIIDGVGVIDRALSRFDNKRCSTDGISVELDRHCSAI